MPAPNVSPLDRQFIGIEALLVDIASGIGEGHRRLLTASHTPIATLSVKQAKVDLTFEMTSRAATDRRGVDLPVLGAKTLALSAEATETQRINQCRISLEIVAIQPEAPEQPKPAPKPKQPEPKPAPSKGRPVKSAKGKQATASPARQPSKGPPKPGRKGGSAAASTPGLTRREAVAAAPRPSGTIDTTPAQIGQLQQALAALTAHFAQRPLPEPLRADVADRFATIRALLQRGDVDAARTALVAFAEEMAPRIDAAAS